MRAIDCLINSGDIPAKMPAWIAMWIMNKFVVAAHAHPLVINLCCRCDELDPESESEKVKDLTTSNIFPCTEDASHDQP